jgi:hypothetical protein
LEASFHSPDWLIHVSLQITERALKQKLPLRKQKQIGSSRLTRLFETASPCVGAFISKLTKLPAGGPPIFPHIFGTGFFVSGSVSPAHMFLVWLIFVRLHCRAQLIFSWPTKLSGNGEPQILRLQTLEF